MTAALVPFTELRRAASWQGWTTLARGAPPFLAPEFFALARPFVTTGAHLVASAWHDDGALAGALPLVLEDHVLRALRCEHSPGYDFCGTPEALRAIWHSILDDDRWSELVLDKVPSASLLASALPTLASASGCPVVVRPDAPHPYFALPGFLEGMKPKFRANLMRCARKAGDLVLERIVVPSRDDLTAAHAIEAMAWKGANGTSIRDDARAEHLYRALARLLGRRGQAALYFLRIGGKRVASLFTLEDGRTLYALKLGYDPAYANVSPGHLLVWKIAEDGEQRGLVELDFVGHEDEWKKKWTDEAHARVAIVIYRRSARGLVRYGLREVVKPLLPEQVIQTPRSPLPRGCQRADLLGEHTAVARVRGKALAGLGIRSGVKRLLAGTRAVPPQLGTPSAFPVGSWVRVRTEAELRATLDAASKTRGLALVPAQWSTCGHTFRVSGHVRRLRDDHGRFRAVSRTVLLEGIDCGHGGVPGTGCGRHCPLMYRDEWLEAAPAEKRPPPQASALPHARVRSLEDIASGLDVFGRQDGVTFMPEMAAHAGKRFPVEGRLGDVFELDGWVKTRAPVYVLGGVHCTGAVCGDKGPCDRACSLLWHRDWLVFERGESP